MSGHILIVDDEKNIADALVFALSSEGFSCSHAATANDGVWVAQQRVPDCILLDVGLPDQSGFAVVTALKQKLPQVPVIFLTARSEEIDKVLGLELGADDYITKPFSLREVVARVRARIRHRSSMGTVIHPIFQLDEEGQRILAHGKMLSLTKSEFLIFSILLRRPESIVSRESLLNSLAAELDVGERVVDTHIKTLRSKIRDAGVEGGWIETHRGLGYSLRKKLDAGE